MKKKIVYLIIGIICLSIILAVLNICVLGEITVNMMPNPMEPYMESLLITKVLTKQKALIPMNIGLNMIFAIIYCFVLYKKNILARKEKFTFFLISALLIIPIIISIKIYISYNVMIIY